jgi:CBS domain containing-hemolysin-like protein
MTAFIAILAVAGTIGATLLAAVVTAAESPGSGASEPQDLDVLHIARLTLLLVASVSAGAVTAWWARPGLEAVGVAIVVGGFVLVTGHLLPRAAAGVAPRLASAAWPVARQIAHAVRPLHAAASATERGMRDILPPEPAPEVGAGEQNMVAGVLSLREETVADVMTPRLDIEGIEAAFSWPQVVEALRHGEHARLPVYGADLDDIEGILYAKDLTTYVAGLTDPPERWQDLLRRPQYVPESKLLTAQLRDFQRGPSHLAIVVDEFGGTAGVVSLEDVLEEIVGEIRGEYDADEEAPYTSEGDDRFWVNGSVTLDELAELLDLSLDREDVTTVGGLIYSELGRVPEPGEELRIDGFRVVVEKVVQRRVRKVYFERMEARDDVAAGDGLPT